MTRIATTIAVLTAATLLSAMPVVAEEGTTGATKDECMLVSQNCRDNVDTIFQRIDRLNREIGKGSSVYSEDELRQLNSRLNDANELLRSIESGG